MSNLCLFRIISVLRGGIDFGSFESSDLHDIVRCFRAPHLENDGIVELESYDLVPIVFDPSTVIACRTETINGKIFSKLCMLQ